MPRVFFCFTDRVVSDNERKQNENRSGRTGKKNREKEQGKRTEKKNKEKEQDGKDGKRKF